jgi:hypothetical protein
MFPFNPTIIMQGIPNDLTCFHIGPLQIVKTQSISLVPDNPRNTTSLKNPDATSFKKLAQRLIKEALHHRMDVYKRRFSFVGKDLPNDVEQVDSYRTHAPLTALAEGCSEGNFCQSPPRFSASFFNCHCLMDDRLEMPPFSVP